MERITEKESQYNNLEQMSAGELLRSINREDQKVANAVETEIPAIEAFVKEAIKNLLSGGRLFYMGAGTSGRLGIVDASECPPTFGVPHDLVIGIMAGGDIAMRKAVEFAEDDSEQAWKDLEAYKINENDVLIGIAASGTTPYVLGAIKKANDLGIITAGISCNPGSPLSQLARFPITPMVGPEFVTGSTRMKSGTAQKLVLNMISTSLMILMGRVKGNRMVDMQLSNNKLIERGIIMVQEELNITYEEAKKLISEHKNVRNAIANYKA